MTEVDLAVHFEIQGFLFDEAAKMDGGRHEEWLDLLHEEFMYRVPVPVSREDPSQNPYDEVLEFANESKSFLKLRFNRVSSDYAWAERPAAYVRHLVTNIQVSPVIGAADGAWDVESNVLVVRARLPEPPVVVSAGRRDRIERRDGRLLLRQRTVFLDTEVPTESQLGVIF